MDWTAWDERQRAKQGVRFFPERRGEHYGQTMWCKWCDQPIPKVIDGKSSTQRLWHPGCLHEFKLHTDLSTQFDFLVDRDGERCAMVGCGATPVKWLRGPVYTITANQVRRGFRSTVPNMIEWARTLWEAPERPWTELTEEERQIGAQQTLDRQTSALEVDHRVALWTVANLPDEERRWYFGPGNLWLLCPPCHKAKTRREAAERAAFKRFVAAQHPLPL